MPAQRGQGQWALGYREPLNPNEQVKKDNAPLNVKQRVLDIYSKQGFNSIDGADLRGRLRWYGLYTQRADGIPGGKTAILEPEELEAPYFMMRVRIDGGQLTSEQLRVIGQIATEFGRDVADVTDRQNVQLHWIRIEDVPEIWERLEAVGLHTTEACGDSPRVILGCPLGGVAAAAVVAVGVTVAVQRPADAPSAGTVGRARTTGSAAPSDNVSPSASTGTSPGADPIEVGDLELVAMAKRMPRFLLDAPGWTMSTVYGFGEGSGTLGFTQGTGEQQKTLQLQWYPAGGYEQRREKESNDSLIAHEPTHLLGDTVTLFTYGPTDHATLLHPDGDSFVEVRGQGLSKADYLAVTAQLRTATVKEFVAALPAGITTPGKQSERAQQVLADIPVPNGFTFRSDGDTLDAYQFGVLVTGQVFCAWADRYYSGDAKAKAQAVAAVETSHGWKVLNDMNAAGDWPEVVWEYADRLASGKPKVGVGPGGGVPSRSELRSGLGCR